MNYDAAYCSSTLALYRKLNSASKEQFEAMLERSRAFLDDLIARHSIIARRALKNPSAGRWFVNKALKAGAEIATDPFVLWYMVEQNLGGKRAK